MSEYLWIECRCGWCWRSNDLEWNSDCTNCGSTVKVTLSRESGGVDPLHSYWTPERIQRQNRRNRVMEPPLRSLWRDETGAPFRWDGEHFRPEEHSFAPEGSMVMDFDDDLSFGGLVKRVVEYYGLGSYQEKTDGVWKAFAAGPYGRSPQVGEGSTRLQSLFSALRSLGGFVRKGAPDNFMPGGSSG